MCRKMGIEPYSVRYKHMFRAEDVILQFQPDKESSGGFCLTVDGKEDDEWFLQQRKKMYERLGINYQAIWNEKRTKYLTWFERTIFILGCIIKIAYLYVAAILRMIAANSSRTSSGPSNSTFSRIQSTFW